MIIFNPPTGGARFQRDGVWYRRRSLFVAAMSVDVVYATPDDNSRYTREQVLTAWREWLQEPKRALVIESMRQQTARATMPNEIAEQGLANYLHRLSDRIEQGRPLPEETPWTLKDIAAALAKVWEPPLYVLRRPDAHDGDGFWAWVGGGATHEGYMSAVEARAAVRRHLGANAVQAPSEVDGL